MVAKVMTKTETVCEAFAVGQQTAGSTLGIPFFIGSLLLTGAVNRHFGNWATWTIDYVCFVVIPAAACISAAMVTSVAPAGQEWSYVRSSAIGHAAVLLSFAGFSLLLFLYASWPFASEQALWLALSMSRFAMPISTLLAATLPVFIFAVVGHNIGNYARDHPACLAARFSKFCWKFSRKKSSDAAPAPFS